MTCLVLNGEELLLPGACIWGRILCMCFIPRKKKPQFKRSKKFCCVFTHSTQVYFSILKPIHLKRSLEVFKKKPTQIKPPKKQNKNNFQSHTHTKFK